jgi:hypothetical protein
MHTIFTLDFFNRSLFFKQGDQEAFWHDPATFITETGWPFALETSGFIACETDRNIFHVERPGGIMVPGRDSDEIVWLEANINKFLELATQQQILRNPVVTMAMVREGNLFATDWVLHRHQEETLLSIPHSITEEKLIEVLQYRQQLRDLTTVYSADTPVDAVVWPTNPLE